MERDDTQRERADDPAAEREDASDDDPTRDPRPPGNPEQDDEAVEKAEEQLGRVTGR